jgi:aryl-alcohol dehydrogenase-like predicted oxidoreductase
LTGRINRPEDLPPGDWRHRYFTPARIAELRERLAPLEPLLRREASSLAEGALRFCLSHPDVSVVIPGMRTPAHARANCALADGRPLSPALLAELRRHAWPRNWYEREQPALARRLLSRIRRVVGGDSGV